MNESVSLAYKEIHNLLAVQKANAQCFRCVWNMGSKCYCILSMDEDARSFWHTDRVNIMNPKVLHSTEIT